MPVSASLIVQLRYGSAVLHRTGLHRLAHLLYALADVAKALREGEDAAALAMLDNVLDHAGKVARDVSRTEDNPSGEPPAREAEPAAAKA
jgi:hypothetical protein